MTWQFRLIFALFGLSLGASIGLVLLQVVIDRNALIVSFAAFCAIGFCIESITYLDAKWSKSELVIVKLPKNKDSTEE